jgi:hypothetical protein
MWAERGWVESDSATAASLRIRIDGRNGAWTGRELVLPAGARRVELR